MWSDLTILFLQCWLFWQDWVSGQLYPKPSISVSPGVVMAVGGAVTIQCKCRCQGMRVVLYKGGDPTSLRYVDSAGDVAEFPISNVTQQDSGSYTCRSGSTSQPFVWSDPSDSIELVMRGRNDPTGLETSPAPSSPGTTWAGGNNSSGFEISLTPASPGTTHTGGNNSSGFETSSTPASPGTTHTGGNDLTGLETSPYPISLGTTQTVLTRSLDFTWGNILRLGLGACVLLALVLIMAAASYCWKETPGEPGSSYAEAKISSGEEPYLLGGLHRAENPSSLPPGNLCFRESHIYSMVLPIRRPDPWEKTPDPRLRAHQPLWHQLKEHLPGPQGVGKWGRSMAQCREGTAHICGKPRVACGGLGAV
ncbi:hypothetical protein KIL84_002009 [Mauremys mutica]|uniref:Ig-like domain-containing protein n=1 Tax=Mauremys mutica TaxID=74926 RepID=A0A9D3XL03_9SAUR|nr:hypothetical protein KIL84_002009 [Mauremys mutica]